MSGVTVTMPRGFESHGWRPRLVVQELPGAIRVHRANNSAEAMRVRDEWRDGNFANTAGEVRVFPDMP